MRTWQDDARQNFNDKTISVSFNRAGHATDLLSGADIDLAAIELKPIVPILLSVSGVAPNQRPDSATR